MRSDGDVLVSELWIRSFDYRDDVVTRISRYACRDVGSKWLRELERRREVCSRWAGQDAVRHGAVSQKKSSGLGLEINGRPDCWTRRSFAFQLDVRPQVPRCDPLSPPGDVLRNRNEQCRNRSEILSRESWTLHVGRRMVRRNSVRRNQLRQHELAFNIHAGVRIDLHRWNAKAPADENDRSRRV